MGEEKVQRTGVRVGWVSEPATEKKQVLRAGGEDFEEKRAGGHVILSKESEYQTLKGRAGKQPWRTTQ